MHNGDCTLISILPELSQRYKFNCLKKCVFFVWVHFIYKAFPLLSFLKTRFHKYNSSLKIKNTMLEIFMHQIVVRLRSFFSLDITDPIFCTLSCHKHDYRRDDYGRKPLEIMFFCCFFLQRCRNHRHYLKEIIFCLWFSRL
jgi:hypothetical protein